MQESNHCILCNSSDFCVIHKKDQWKYLRCPDCGLVRLDPRPSAQELMKNYQDYLPIQPEEISKWEMLMRPVVDKSADLIEARMKLSDQRSEVLPAGSASQPGKESVHSKKASLDPAHAQRAGFARSRPVKTSRGKLLDIGCGYGFFLQEMKSRGWQVKGIELSRAGRHYSRDKWDIRVYSEPLENLEFSEDSFDVTTLFYVIEHVLDPLALLMEVKRILKPNGLVLVRWPHSTPIVKILGPLSAKLDLYHTPYHLYDFSPHTIEELLARSGFEQIQTSIGGYTRPSRRLHRWVSNVFGQLGELLYLLSGGNILLPGISKTTLAFKACK